MDELGGIGREPGTVTGPPRRRPRLRAAAAVLAALVAVLWGPGAGATAGAAGIPTAPATTSTGTPTTTPPAPADDVRTEAIAPPASGPVAEARLAGQVIGAATRAFSATCALGAPGSSQWAFQAVGPDGCPLRWDPCTVIDWWYNPITANRPESDVVWAVQSVAAATGLNLRYRGVTSLTVGQWLVRPIEQGSGLLVGFDGLATGVLGEATTQALADPSIPAEILRAGITFTTRTLLTREEFRTVMLHEVAHAVGLDHVADPTALMSPFYNGVRGFGPGDLEGLRLVGAQQGCLPGSIRSQLVAANPWPVLPTDRPGVPADVPPTPDPRVPVGVLEDVVVDGGTVRVRGWAYDVNTRDPIGVAYGTVAFGRGQIVRIGLTGLPRPDVALAFNSLAANSGFDLAVDVPPGRHTVCVGALDHSGAGSTGLVTNLGCREVQVVK